MRSPVRMRSPVQIHNMKVTFWMHNARRLAFWGLAAGISLCFLVWTTLEPGLPMRRFCQPQPVHAPLPANPSMMDLSLAEETSSFPTSSVVANPDDGSNSRGPVFPVSSTCIPTQQPIQTRCLKIYVYELPDRYNSEQIQISQDRPAKIRDPDCRTNFYSLEFSFHQYLLTSSVRTQDPEEATMFYVPAYLSCYLINNHPNNLTKTGMFGLDALNYIRTEFPYWSRSGGRDHVWTFSQGYGPELMGPNWMLTRSSVFLVHNGQFTRPEFSPRKDIAVVPDISRYGWAPVYQLLEEERVQYRIKKYLMHFGGTVNAPASAEETARGHQYSRGVRQYITEHLANKPDVRITNKPRSDSYIEDMRSSTFCICPEGWHAWSPRPYYAILHNCIPVSMTEELEFPYEEFINYDEFIIRLRPRDVAQLYETLAAISPEEIARRQQAMEKVWQLYWYGEGGLAYDAVLHMMERRLMPYQLSRQFHAPADKGERSDTALGYSFPTNPPSPQSLPDPLSYYERETAQTGVWSHVAPEAKQYFGLGLGSKSTHVAIEVLDAREREYTLAHQYAQSAVKDKYRTNMESVSVAYHRLHPMYGSVYKFLTSAPDAKGNTKHLEVTVTRTLDGQPPIKGIEELTQGSIPVSLLIPVLPGTPAGELDALNEELLSLMKQDDNINVVFTVARTRNNAVPLVQKLATTFGEYAKRTKASIVQKENDYLRGLLVQQALKDIDPANLVLLLPPSPAGIDVSMVQRCRALAKPHARAFFPIELGHHDEVPSANSNSSGSDPAGFWRENHFETVCIYASDVPETWESGSARDLYEGLVRAKAMSVFRATEPAIRRFGVVPSPQGGYEVAEPLTDFERNNGQSGEWALIMETPTETREYRTGLDSMNSPSKPIVDMAAIKEYQSSIDIAVEALRQLTPDATTVDIQRRMHAYHRLHNIHGSVFKLALDVDMKKTDGSSIGGQRMVTVSRGGIEGRQTSVAVSDFNHATPVWMVVPIHGVPDHLVSFLNQFNKLASEDPNIHLVIVYQDELPEDKKNVTDTVDKALWRYKDRYTIHLRKGDPSRAQGIQKGYEMVGDNDLVFVCDIDMIIKSDFFRRCRTNARQGFSVYYPIVYSLYPSAWSLGQLHGFWRDFGFGMLCGYKSDFMAVGGFKANKFVGWGGEDNDLYNRFKADTRFDILRAVEPSLIHKWHTKECSPDLDDARALACHKTMLVNMGQQVTLAELVYRHNIDYIGEANDILTNGLLPKKADTPPPAPAANPATPAKAPADHPANAAAEAQVGDKPDDQQKKDDQANVEADAKESQSESNDVKPADDKRSDAASEQQSTGDVAKPDAVKEAESKAAEVNSNPAPEKKGGR